MPQKPEGGGSQCAPADPWALTIEDYRDRRASTRSSYRAAASSTRPSSSSSGGGWRSAPTSYRVGDESDEERRALALPRRQDLERDEPDAFYSAEEVRQLETNEEDLGSRSCRSCPCRTRGDVGPSGPAHLANSR